MENTRVERIAGDDSKITQADIIRLETHDEHDDLGIAREILPRDFFAQLEAGKWFGIGKGSALSRAGYIDKLNQIGENYREEREQIQQETSEKVRTLEFRGTWKYENVLSAGNRRTRQDEIYNLQVALHLAGYGDMTPDGVWGNDTRVAMQRLVSEMPNIDEGYENGTMMNQLIFDFLYQKVFGEQPSEEISSKNFSANRNISEEANPLPSENETREVSFSRTLKLSRPLMRGEDVKLLQQKLTEAGYSTGSIDGVFGKNTQRALISYQREKLGQTGDGVMDFPGVTMQSFGQQSIEDSTQTPLRHERRTYTNETEAKDDEQRHDIQQALQENGVVDPEVVERVEGSLVTLTSGLGAPRGSGSFIAPNMILTAEHVIRDLETMEYRNIFIRDAAGNRYDIVQIYVDPSNNDIAFIETRQNSQNYLPLAQGNVEARVNQEGVLLGFHQNRPRFQRTQTTETMKYTETQVHPHFEDAGQDFGYFDALPGDSGGPIILSDGSVGGMVIERYEQGGQGTIYETAQYIQSVYNQIT